MKRLHIETSPLTNTIFCGTVLKAGTWGANKQDLTAEALWAVAEHVERFGKPVIVGTESNPSVYEITVKRLDQEAQ